MKRNDLIAMLRRTWPSGSASRLDGRTVAAGRDSDVRVVETTAQIDAMLQECERAAAISDDALRAVFLTFQMVPPANIPEDPFSVEYRAFQMALYETIAGKAYRLANEASLFDVDAAVSRPFPYTTASSTTVGEHYMAIGFLVRVMSLPPGSRILEFGPGWGNLTIALAKMGHQVTVVDVEPRYCELIRRRAEREGLSIEAINGDFFWPGLQERRFDAVVFFECFHHCDDHARLLSNLRSAIVPKGKLFFGAEPILPDFHVKWGLRLDGQSLWAIRKNGWLELGFHEEYFRSLLERTGWYGFQTQSDDIKWMTVWTAVRHDERWVDLKFGADDRRILTKVGRRVENVIQFGGRAGTGLFGPYVRLPPGRYLARLRFSPDPILGAAAMDICVSAAHTPICRRSIRDGDVPGNVAGLEFQLAEDTEQVEVRLFCRAGFKASLLSVEIELLSA
jgi:ubiquinone/menaquinone biosynthesis C-methylase UbiE